MLLRHRSSLELLLLVGVEHHLSPTLPLAERQTFLEHTCREVQVSDDRTGVEAIVEGRAESNHDSCALQVHCRGQVSRVPALHIATECSTFGAMIGVWREGTKLARNPFSHLIVEKCTPSFCMVDAIVESWVRESKVDDRKLQLLLILFHNIRENVRTKPTVSIIR